MKLKLRRSQKAGMMGKVVFGLDIRAQLTDEEAANVKKYKMGNICVYSKEKINVDGLGDAISAGAVGVTRGLAKSLAARALNLTISIKDLVEGKHIECKDILEMRAAEEQIKEACALFKEMLETAAQFGGEEVIEFGEAAAREPGDVALA